MAPITDEELVAYLDGMLDTSRRADIDVALTSDEAVAARLRALDVDTAAIRTAFDLLDTAEPVARLRERLAAAGRVSSKRRWTDLRWQSMAATLLLGAAMGYGATHLIAGGKQTDWRTAVADYQVLYTASTLTPLRIDPTAQAAEVERAGNAIGRPITLAALQVAGLDFKRAQILGYHGRPLVQFAYLDRAGTPVAFCAMRTGEADGPVRTTELRGLAAASWTRGGYAFVVIGGTQPEAVQRVATELSLRV
jgi:anti-sigma factor RsiW